MLDRAPLPLQALLLLTASLLAACQDSSPPGPEPEPDAAVPEEDAAPEPTSGFEADPTPDGASLRIGAQLEGETVRIEVIGEDLGPVFGLSYELRWSGEALALDESDLGAIQPSFLADAGSDDAILLAVRAPQGLALGGTRVDPALGEADLDGEVRLAEIELRALAAGESRLDLARVAVRRADGSFTPVALAGGTVTLVEVTP